MSVSKWLRAQSSIVSVDQFVGRVRELHHQNLRGDAQTIVMLAQQHEMEFFVIGVPVAANALEAAGAVLQAVREQADLGLVVSLERAVRIDDRR